MNTPDEPTLARWLDGAMNAAEVTAFEQHLNSTPGLREHLEALKADASDDDVVGHLHTGPAVAADLELRGLLRTHFALERPLPRMDDFNAKILDEITVG
ncbi:MAG: hypothetical protein ACOYMN_14845 [Roseimicrobium sp.]